MLQTTTPKPEFPTSPATSELWRRLRLLLLLVPLVWLTAASGAFAQTVLGTGSSALLGGDLTHRDGTGGGVEAYGELVDWVDAGASSSPGFSPEDYSLTGAFDIFDNQVGGGTKKWAYARAPQHVWVELERPYRLTHFTLASGDGREGRDPTVWYIEGSNDGSDWTVIYSYDSPRRSPFSARNQVLRFDAGEDFDPPDYYSFFRYRVEQTKGAVFHEISELELFGDEGHPDCANDTWDGCSRARLEIEAAFDQVPGAGPATPANYDAAYFTYRQLVVDAAFEPVEACQAMIDALISMPEEGVYDVLRRTTQYFHICGWDESYLDVRIDLAVWLDAEDFDPSTGRWPGKQGTSPFVPSTDDGSYAFEAPIHKANDLLGRDGVFFDGNHMLQADFDSREIGDTFTSFAVYRPEEDSALTEDWGTGLTDSIWTEIGSSRSNPRHETSLHVDRREVVIEIVEATRIDGDSTRVLKWRNGELVANEIHAFNVEGSADTFGPDEGADYDTEWQETNLDNGAYPLYEEEHHRLNWANGNQEVDHVVLNHRVVSSKDLEIQVDVGAADDNGRHFIYFFYQDEENWYRLKVTRTQSVIQRRSQGHQIDLASGPGVAIDAGEPLKSWNLSVHRSGSIRFTSDGEMMIDHTAGGEFLNFQSSQIGLGGNDRQPIWDNFRFRVNPDVDFNVTQHSPYGEAPPDDPTGVVQVEDDGSTLYLAGSHWKKIDFPYTITENTVLELDFESTAAGLNHAIGFDTDGDSFSSDRVFLLYDNGVDNYPWEIEHDNHYSGEGRTQFSIPVGRYFTGQVNYMVFINESDPIEQSNSRFSNIRVREAPGDGVALGCDHVVTDGNGNWDGSDCSSFTLGELLIYDKTLSDWERSNVERYLSQKWGIDVANKDRFLGCARDRLGMSEYELLSMDVQFPDRSVFDDLSADCSGGESHPEVRELHSQAVAQLQCEAGEFTSGMCLGALVAGTYESGGRFWRTRVGTKILGACALTHAWATTGCLEAVGSPWIVEPKEPDWTYQANGTVTDSYFSDYSKSVGVSEKEDCAVYEDTELGSEHVVGDPTEASRNCCVAMTNEGSGFEASYTSCKEKMKILCNFALSDGTEGDVTYEDPRQGSLPFLFTTNKYPLKDADSACMSEFLDSAETDLEAARPRVPVAFWPHYDSQDNISNTWANVSGRLSGFNGKSYGLGGFGSVRNCNGGSAASCQDGTLVDGRPIGMGSGTGGGSGETGSPGRPRDSEEAVTRLAKRARFEGTQTVEDKKKTHNALSVHSLDVGQGSCHLIQCVEYNDQGQVVDSEGALLDCGWVRKGTAFRNAAQVIGYLGLHSFERASSPLFLSHGDMDHSSLISKIYPASNVLPSSVDFGGYYGEYPGVTTKWIRQSVSQGPRNIPMNGDFTIQPLTSIWDEGDAKFPLRFESCNAQIDLVAVNLGLSDREPVNLRGSSEKKNEVSSVLKVSTDSDSYSVLLPGDATAGTEAYALGKGSLVNFPISGWTALLGSHHGSKGSNTADWLNFLRPDFLIFSSGKPSKFGHPHEQVKDRSEATGSLYELSLADRHPIAFSQGKAQDTNVVNTRKGYFSTHSTKSFISRLWIPRDSANDVEEHEISYTNSSGEHVRKILSGN